MKVIPMIGFLILGILSALSILAIVYGVDSREGSMDPRRPIYPVGLR